MLNFFAAVGAYVLKALIVAAFMAVATSGLAAVTTTTTYNTASGKVEVAVDVTGADGGSEVTYLVKSNNQIVYIDQQTATDAGTVDFDYKIDRSKVSTLQTEVKFGTNGKAIVYEEDDELVQLSEITITSDAGVKSIELFRDQACELPAVSITGDADELYAKVTLENNYKVKNTIGLGVASGNVYPVNKGAKIIGVTTESTYVAPNVGEPNDIEIDVPENLTVKDKNNNDVPAKAVTKVLKVIGSPAEVGVRIGKYEFPALAMNSTIDSMNPYTETDGICAVRIVVGEEVVLDELEAYFKPANN